MPTSPIFICHATQDDNFVTQLRLEDERPLAIPKPFVLQAIPFPVSHRYQTEVK